VGEDVPCDEVGVRDDAVGGGPDRQAIARGQGARTIGTDREIGFSRTFDEPGSARCTLGLGRPQTTSVLSQKFVHKLP
jgi:hypothetical protein